MAAGGVPIKSRARYLALDRANPFQGFRYKRPEHPATLPALELRSRDHRANMPEHEASSLLDFLIPIFSFR